MHITINGEAREFNSPLSVQGLTEQLQLNPRQVAVERNLAIVPRSTYAQVAVQEGDVFEIVHFIGGG